MLVGKLGFNVGNLKFKGSFFREISPENNLEKIRETHQTTDSFERTHQEAQRLLNEMLSIDIDEYWGVEIPKFSATKQYLELDEITRFHNEIAQKDDRDAISYDFYTTENDIGSGFAIAALPIRVAKDKETKEEMIKEVNRLLFEDSKLSPYQKRNLLKLYSKYFTSKEV